MRSVGEWKTAVNAHDDDDLKSGFLSLIQDSVANVWGPERQPLYTLRDLDVAFAGDQSKGITVQSR